MLASWRSVFFVAAVSVWPLCPAEAQTVTFNFDTGTPALATGQGTPFDQTSGGVTAHFSSPTDPAFSIQTDVSTGWHMSQFSGHYLYDNNLNVNLLDIKFSRSVTAITFTFATADFQQVEVPTTIQAVAYMDSKATLVGSTTAHGTYGSDTMPMGTLTFNSGGQPFNLVEIGIPRSPLAASDFFVDNIVVTLGPPAAPVLTTPANGVSGVVVAPVLTWEAASGATSYDVYFGTLSTPPMATNTSATTYSPGTLTQNTTYYWQVAARNASGVSSSTIWSFTTGVPGAALQFVPVTPCRVVDTRNAAGAFGGPSLTGGSTRSFTIPQGSCGIPTTAPAYSLNVTAVPQGPLAYLTLWPAGQTQPLVSTLNSLAGDVVANAAIVPAGAGGAVSVFAADSTDLVLDINGYFDPSGGPNAYAFYPTTPCRVADTRNAAGTFGGPTMPAGGSRDFPIPSSACAIPATARAYSANLTVVPGSYLGYLTTWPTGAPQPLVSTLNSWRGKIVANAALVPAGTNESISVFVSNPTDVILDVNGYFAAPGGSNSFSFYPVTPCRVADTRNAAGPFGGPAMDAGAVRSFAVPASSCFVPMTAAAYSLNITVVPQGPLAYLSAWPAGSPQPLVSTLNSVDGSIVANAAIVPAGAGGAISVFVAGRSDVILDINGYFAP